MKEAVPLPVRAFRTFFKTVGPVMPTMTGNIAFRLFCTPINKKVREHELTALQQAQPRSMSFAGKKIKLYQWGSGPKLAVLVHGWEGHAGSMGAFVDPLLDRGYRVLAFDGPAHGKSEGKATNLVEFSGVLSRIMEENGSPDLLVSHSFGSAVSIMAAVRSGIAIPKIVMLSTPNRLDDVLMEFYDMVHLPKPLREHVDNRVTAIAGMSPAELQVAGLAPRTNIGKALLIHDVNDKILPFGNSDAIAANWDSAELKPKKDIGHYRMLWNEDVVAETLAF